KSARAGGRRPSWPRGDPGRAARGGPRADPAMGAAAHAEDACACDCALPPAPAGGGGEKRRRRGGGGGGGGGRRPARLRRPRRPCRGGRRASGRLGDVFVLPAEHGRQDGQGLRRSPRA
ncbi:unnamed protein product, partial [Prorocentrum cordatum]